MADIIRGTELKFILNIEPIDGISMRTFDFNVIAYAANTTQRNTIPKTNCIAIDSDSYTLPVDTAALGLGQLILDVYAYIPDQNFPDNLRTEICRLETDITLIQ